MKVIWRVLKLIGMHYIAYTGNHVGTGECNFLINQVKPNFYLVEVKVWFDSWASANVWP